MYRAFSAAEWPSQVSQRESHDPGAALGAVSKFLIDFPIFQQQIVLASFMPMLYVWLRTSQAILQQDPTNFQSAFRGQAKVAAPLAGIAMMRVICLAGALWQGMAIPAIEIAPGAPWLQLDRSGDGTRVSQVGMPSPRSRCRW